MPTDVLAALERKRATERRDNRRDQALIVLISVAGCGLTVLRALQSEVFESALIALGTLE